MKPHTRNRRRTMVALTLVGMALAAATWIVPPGEIRAVVTIALAVYVIAWVYIVVFMAARNTGDEDQ